METTQAKTQETPTEEPKKISFREEGEKILDDLKEAYETVRDSILEEMDELISSLPPDMAEASTTVATKIIELKFDITKLKTKVGAEFKELEAYLKKAENHARREKVKIKISISGRPTGKLSIGDIVNAKYLEMIDTDELDFLETRYIYIRRCLEELNELWDTVKALSIQYHGARKRNRDEQHSYNRS